MTGLEISLEAALELMSFSELEEALQEMEEKATKSRNENAVVGNEKWL